MDTSGIGRRNGTPPASECRACEIRLRAERKAGQLLKEMEKAKGGRPPKTASPMEAVSPPTLEQLGVSDKQSHRWQQLADVPEEQFETALAAPEKPPRDSGGYRLVGIRRAAASKIIAPTNSPHMTPRKQGFKPPNTSSVYLVTKPPASRSASTPVMRRSTHALP